MSNSFDGPELWIQDRIRDQITSIVGGDWGAEPDDEEGINTAVIRVADLDGIRLGKREFTVRSISPSSRATRALSPRSLVIEKSGGGENQLVGRAAIVGDIEVDAICSNFMAKIECGYKVEPAFVNYLLHDLYNAGVNTQSIKQTTGIQNLDVAAYLNTEVSIPSVTKQQLIATYLDASCKAIDAAIAAKQRQIETLAGVYRAELQRVMTCGLHAGPVQPTGNHWLPQAPVGWSLPMLKRLCDIQNGLTLGKVYEGALLTLPYLRVANVQDGHLALDDVSTIDIPPELAARVRLEHDDVLMTEGGDLDKLGRGVVWRGEIADCLHQNHIFAVRCLPWKLRPQYLAYLTASQYGRDYFEATGKKTTNLAATNATKVGQFPIPLPPLPEQDAAIAHLNRKSAASSALKAMLQQQIDTLTAYRKSLIHECVTGQRRVTAADVVRVSAAAHTP